MRLYGWVFGAVFGIFAVSATFCQVFSGFLAGFGCCFGDFCSFSYFLRGILHNYGRKTEKIYKIIKKKQNFASVLIP